MPKSVSRQRWLVPLLICLGLFSAFMAIRWRTEADLDAEFEDEGKGKQEKHRTRFRVGQALIYITPLLLCDFELFGI